MEAIYEWADLAIGDRILAAVMAAVMVAEASSPMASQWIAYCLQVGVAVRNEGFVLQILRADLGISMQWEGRK